MMLRKSVAASLFAMLLAQTACTNDEAKMQEPVAEDAVEDGAAEPAAADAEMTGQLTDEQTPIGGEAIAATEAPAETGVDAAAIAAEPMPETTPVVQAAQPAAEVAMTGKTVSVKAYKLNVRSGPGTNHKIVRTLKRGEVLNEISRTKRWVKIGENEYVSARYVKKASASAKAKAKGKAKAAAASPAKAAPAMADEAPAPAPSAFSDPSEAGE